MIQLLSTYGTDLAIGTLKTYEVNRSDGQWFCAASLIWLTGSWFLLYRLVQVARHDRDYHGMLKMLAFLLLCATLQLPILYGYYVHSTEVPRVALTVSDAKQPTETCGLLLFNTGSDIFIWNSVLGKGEVQQIPVSRLQQISYVGEEDLIANMHSARAPEIQNCP
jgi:hypothetical protein